MDQQSAIAIVVAAVIGVAAIAVILARRDREVRATTTESATAASSEGETVCPNCGMGNLVGDANCAACGVALPSHRGPQQR